MHSGAGDRIKPACTKVEILPLGCNDVIEREYQIQPVHVRQPSFQNHFTKSPKSGNIKVK